MELSLTNLLGHVGYVLIAIGMLLLVHKVALGWLLRLSGEFIWAIVGFMMDMSSLWFWAIFFVCLDAYGYCSWKKKQDQAAKSA